MDMSTRPDLRADDELVGVLSHWLARHVGDDELRRAVTSVELSDLAPGQAEAVDELRSELAGEPARGGLEMIVRETLEALAYGE